jgi:hypothetical protein
MRLCDQASVVEAYVLCAVQESGLRLQAGSLWRTVGQEVSHDPGEESVSRTSPVRGGHRPARYRMAGQTSSNFTLGRLVPVNGAHML